jgi:hypothetical protein
VRFTASASGIVDFVVTDGEIDVKFDDAATIIGNDDGQAAPIRLQDGARMAVDIAGGNVQLTATNVAINNTDAAAIPVAQKTGASFAVEQKAGAEFKRRGYLAAQVTDYDPVAVGAARVMLVAVDVTRRGLRVKNAGDKQVALGGVALSFANAVILIQPGETWNK